MRTVKLSTAAIVEDYEKTRGLSQSDLNLLKEAFQPCFYPPMYTWALMAKDSKRRKLFAMLQCAHGKDKVGMKTRKCTEILNDPEFVLRTGQYTIDLNRSFNQNVILQKDPRHYYSAIREFGVFEYGGERPSTTTVRTRSINMAPSVGHCYAKKLFNPEFYQKFYPFVDTNATYLKILTDYCEEKAKGYPINPLSGTNLDPYQESKIVKGTLKEDHIYEKPPGHRTRNLGDSTTGSRPLTTGGSTVVSRSMNANPILPRSNYMENFTEEPFKNLIMTKSIKPLKTPSPFSRFPDTKEVSMSISREQYMEQATMNKQCGIKNREIYQSKTCL
ncbi:hypothetical protein TVAG_301830 [Trichomonas vaginalis G3]|uniref:Uncharacterized protein n=1 Tax=Trichomonas vaginalis (strain ATCC PRA-98 / G3) TaxID=412133 RepID=A2FG23_TRIV3|nr:hypothetical protein TVAGG3_0674750 [Trichomonas vaginalis G3]EAX96142.1 hypothetical protein TVAG_301830 [Trichomonas vaginalis G3]KAI5507453.1 hypothetical protein TVAGG3_0674750 [Trichomonas vaginalis G3]|eukprot:XP_001309072.1 hypothetical protein [Trichomonas vaginalis G3]